MSNVSFLYTERHKQHYINTGNQMRYLSNMSYDRGKKQGMKNMIVACLLCAFMGFMAGRVTEYAQTYEGNAGLELPVKLKEVDMGLPR